MGQGGEQGVSAYFDGVLTRLNVLLEHTLDRARTAAARHLDGVVVGGAGGLLSAANEASAASRVSPVSCKRSELHD